MPGIACLIGIRMKWPFVLLALSATASGLRAEVIFGAHITKLYAQSRVESTAHLIQVNQTISNSACDANRLYIDLNDKELFATALANYLQGRAMDIVYNTNSPSKYAAGHVNSIPCRIMSIF